MEVRQENSINIFCEDDQHFHRGEIIKYLMVKKDKGTINKRLFCDECYLGKYSSFQQNCCDIQELINGNIYEAFKNTKFDSNFKQEFFNYAKNHFPYLNEEFIINMITSLREEITSIIDDLQNELILQSKQYLEDINKWATNENLLNYFNCDELKKNLLDIKFERSPLKFEVLNQSAEDFVKKINDQDELGMKININNIIEKQKKFFNLERFNNSFNEVLQTIQTMIKRTFSEYNFSKSSLSTPFIEQIIQRIAPKDSEEQYHKALNRIYRFTRDGSNYQTIQQINKLQTQDTLTIIQTKNKCIFGVYNCLASPEKSFLFQMNKEKIFSLRKNKRALNLNLTANLSSWIMDFGQGDILINSTFTQCRSNLGNGFDIDGTDIWNQQEYLSDSLQFDIYDMEIFEFQFQVQVQGQFQGQFQVQGQGQDQALPPHIPAPVLRSTFRPNEQNGQNTQIRITQQPPPGGFIPIQFQNK